MTLQDYLRLHEKTMHAVAAYDYYKDEFANTVARYPTIASTESTLLIAQFWIDFLKSLPQTPASRTPYPDIKILSRFI